MIADFEGGRTAIGTGCIARIRAEGAYESARYVAAPGEAAGGLWRQISLEKVDLGSK